jgi:hypothetical protein
MSKNTGASGLKDQFAKMFGNGAMKATIDTLTKRESNDMQQPPPSTNVDLIQPISVQTPSTLTPRGAKRLSGNLSNSSTNNQTNKDNIKQSIEQSDKQQKEQQEKQETGQAGTQQITQRSEHYDEQSSEQSPKRDVQQMHHQSIHQAIKQLPKQSARYAWLPLTENQGRVLQFLFEHGGGLSNMDIVCEATGIAYGTARTAIDILQKERYITAKSRFNGHSFRGFKYTVDNHLCSLYISRVKSTIGDQSDQQSIKQSFHHAFAQTPLQSSDQTNGLSNSITITSSSSDRQEITTTIMTGPEMAYWEEQGLQEKQAQKWCSEFEVDPGDMRQQLAWARWDLVNNEKENEIQVPINWFFGVLRKTAGCYPPPKNYQSPAEIRAGRLKTQRESEHRAMQDLAKEEIEARFRALLADPTGTQYQQLLQTVPELARGMRGKALESILRDSFFAENREG